LGDRRAFVRSSTSDEVLVSSDESTREGRDRSASLSSRESARALSSVTLVNWAISVGGARLGSSRGLAFHGGLVADHTRSTLEGVIASSTRSEGEVLDTDARGTRVSENTSFIRRSVRSTVRASSSSGSLSSTVSVVTEQSEGTFARFRARRSAVFSNANSTSASARDTVNAVSARISIGNRSRGNFADTSSANEVVDGDRGIGVTTVRGSSASSVYRAEGSASGGGVSTEVRCITNVNGDLVGRSSSASARRSNEGSELQASGLERASRAVRETSVISTGNCSDEAVAAGSLVSSRVSEASSKSINT